MKYRRENIGVNLLVFPSPPHHFVTMKTVQRFFVAAIAIVSPLSAFKPASALGIYGYSVSAVSDPYTYSPPNNFANQTPSSMVIPTTVSSAISLPNGANANGSVTGSAGTLKAYAFAQLPAMTPDATNAQTHSSVRGEDQLTVTSSTLALNTPVTLLITLNLDGTLLPRSAFAIDGNYFGSAGVAASFSVGDGQTGVSLGYSSDADPQLRNAGPSPFQINQFLTGTLTTAVGRQVNLDFLLDASTSLFASSPAKTSEMDFSHTSRFFIDAQTPDVVLTSFSGHNYASPTTVPTPALLPGLIALGASMLRQRKKVCA